MTPPRAPLRLTSTANPRVKRLVRLRMRRHRREEGVFLMEEPRVVARALAAGVIVREVYHCPEIEVIHPEAATLLARLTDSGAQIVEVSRPVLGKMAYRRNPTGLVVVAETPVWTPDKLELPPSPLLLVLENVEKPGNLGAVVRSASGAGVDAVIACGAGADPWNPNALRASTGAVFSVPTLALPRKELVPWLRERRLTLVATAPDAEQPYTKVDLTGPTAVLLGAEDKGLSEDLLTAADGRCRIPMLGEADSLNVSVSAALLAYEARRQRGMLAGGRR